MNLFKSIDLGQIFVPDAAKFWSTLWDGFAAAGVFGLIHFLGALLVGVGFIHVLYQYILSANLQPLTGAGLRLLIAGTLIASYPTLRGTSDQNGLVWRTYHGVYGLVFGGGSANQNSFYGTWVSGKLGSTFKDMKAAMGRLALLKATLVGVEGTLNAATKFTGVARFAKLPVPAAVGVEALDTIANELKRTTQEASNQVSRAMKNLFGVLVMLAGVHALLTYATIAILALVTFFLPLFAGLWLFKPLERAFPTVLGLLISCILAVPITGIMLGTSAVMIFGISAERISDSIPKQEDMAAIEKAAADVQKKLAALEPEAAQKAAENQQAASRLQGIVNQWNQYCNIGTVEAGGCAEGATLGQAATLASNNDLYNRLATPLVHWELVLVEDSIQTGRNRSVTFKTPVFKRQEIDLRGYTRAGLAELAGKLRASADHITSTTEGKRVEMVSAVSSDIVDIISNAFTELVLSLMIATTVTLVISGVMAALTIFVVSRVVLIASDFNIGSGISPGALPVGV